MQEKRKECTCVVGANAGNRDFEDLVFLNCVVFSGRGRKVISGEKGTEVLDIEEVLNGGNGSCVGRRVAHQGPTLCSRVAGEGRSS